MSRVEVIKVHVDIWSRTFRSVFLVFSCLSASCLSVFVFMYLSVSVSSVQSKMWIYIDVNVFMYVSFRVCVCCVWCVCVFVQSRVSWECWQSGWKASSKAADVGDSQ